jgi:hypothetical protein
VDNMRARSVQNTCTTEYCVGEKLMWCLLTNFVHNLHLSGLVLSEGNVCIIIPSVCVEFLQLTPPGAATKRVSSTSFYRSFL